MNFSLQSKLGAWALIAVLWVGVMPATVMTTTGCSFSAASVKADGQAVNQALLSIANLEEATNPTLAANLVTAANVLLAVTNNWTTGSAISDFNTAANAVEAILAVIPQTSAIAPLIPIAVAAIDILIASIQPATSNVTAMYQVSNPYRGKATIHHRFGRSKAGDFKAAWDQAAKANNLNVVLF